MIDKAFIDADGYYTGARMMNMGIAYNTLNVEAADAPKSWNDLLDAKWNDQVVMTDPNTAGTTKYWRNAIMANPKYGVPFMEKLKANKCYFESGTTATHNGCPRHRSACAWTTSRNSSRKARYRLRSTQDTGLHLSPRLKAAKQCNAASL